MCCPVVCRRLGKRRRVTLLLKNPEQPVEEANPTGITISFHISKPEPTAWYGLATAINKWALGGPCLVGGMRVVSLR